MQVADRDQAPVGEEILLLTGGSADGACERGHLGGSCEPDLPAVAVPRYDLVERRGKAEGG